MPAKQKLIPMSSVEELGDPSTHVFKSGSCVRPKKDLDELAVGTGFGLRYDFGLFLLRLDMGFKTHNPVMPKGERWNLNYRLKNANPTLGINYPF